MIQPLRRVHARAFLALGIFLPILFIAGVKSRRISASVPIAKAQTHATSALSERTITVDGARVTAKVLRDGASTAMQISSSPELLAPDVLVYASTSEPKNHVSTDAVLLGAFVSGKTYRLPSANSRFVLLYSLPRRQLLAAFRAGDGR
jgi:hypothetical protein